MDRSVVLADEGGAEAERGFFRVVLGLALASALCSLLLRLTAPWWSLLPLADYFPHVLFAYVLYGGMAYATGRRVRPEPQLAAPAAAGVLMGLCLPAYGALGVTLFGAAMGAAVPDAQASRGRRAATASAVALSCLLGALGFGALQSVAALGALVPQVLLGGLLGGIFGAWLGVGALPEYLGPGADPVQVAYEQARRELTGRLLDHVARCWTVHQRIVKGIDRSLFPGGDWREFRATLDDVVLRTFDLARRWQEVEGYLTRLDPADLKSRMADADAKLLGTQDPVSQAQYRKIRGSLERRLAEYDELQQAKERVMSRLEYYFTVLEDLQLASVRLKSSTAQADSATGAELLGRIEDLAADLKATSRTLDGLGSEAAPPRLGD